MMRKEEPIIPEINITKCTRCGVCALVCSNQAITAHNGFPGLSNLQNCTLCAKCEDICPTGAISIPFEITWGDGPNFY